MIYRGFDVLVQPPNTREEPADTFRRSVATFDPGSGPWDRSPLDRAPHVQRSYLWTCRSKAEITLLRQFLAARRGQAVPFWVPSWRRDILLAQDLSPALVSFQIKFIGYTRTAYQHASRRHLAIYPPSGLILRHVDAAVESGTTETLTIDTPCGISVPSSTLVSNLLLCRMATDEPEIVHHTNSIAECQIPYIEIPEEAP